MKPRLNCTRTIKKRKVRRRKQFIIETIQTWSLNHAEGNAMAWACMAGNGIRLVVFGDDVTVDRSSRVNSKVYQTNRICSSVTKDKTEGMKDT